MRSPDVAIAMALVLSSAGSVLAQDTNIFLPVAEVEQKFQEADFEVVDIRTSQGLPTERTYSVTARFEGDEIIRLKLAPAPEGGDAFNNKPQYELAAYEIQRLFLDPSEYVVPPTVARAYALEDVRSLVGRADPTRDPIPPTFDGWNAAVVVLSYWLWNVDVPERNDIRDRDRIKEDDQFATYVGNFNLLTYLIRHLDGHDSNFLMSTNPETPRVFSIDNGVSFRSQPSDRGDYWRQIRVDRLPARTIDRLRAVTLEDLERTLGVMVQFESQGAEVKTVDATANLDPEKSFRVAGQTVQIGLTQDEIEDVHERLRDLMEDVDKGDYDLIGDAGASN